MTGVSLPAAEVAPRRRTGILRRELGLWSVAALSLGVMAPTLAMSVVPTQVAGEVGRAAPVAFALAAVGVALVAFGFILLSSRIASAGSVYAFVGEALGPRAGLFAGWALLGTYLVFPPTSMAAMAVFGEAFLRTSGIDSTPAWLPIALLCWALALLLASRDIRVTTRWLIVFEAISVVLISALLVVIFFDVGIGGGPTGQDLNADFLDLPPGTTATTLALAGTFGFLCFCGFESAGSLGEEAERPRRMIPRSLAGAVAFGGVFYVICVTGQTLGFGTSAEGVKTFQGSTAPINDLAVTYVGKGLAEALDVGAMLSALGAAVGGLAVGSRMLFAFGRDRILPTGLTGLSSGTGAPLVGLFVVSSLSLIGLVTLRALGHSAIETFSYFATIGVLSLLVMYIVTSFAALRLFGHGWEAAVLVAGIAVAGYVLWKHLSPVPPSPFDVFPYLVAGWLAVGLAVGWRRTSVSPG